MKYRRLLLLTSSLIFAGGVLYDLGLQTLMRPFAAEGVYFQSWSSEDMMQTVPLMDLRNDPLQTLVHIHIEPPALDFLRAAFVQFWPSLSDRDALVRVDYSLYVFWALILGALGVVAFLQMARETGLVAGILGALLLLLHPASIYFATYLDTTLLTAFLILLAYYLLWKIKNGYAASILLLTAVTLGLFFTRSIFQWPSLLIFALSLLLLGVARRQLITYLLIAGIISTLYIAKQLYLFGTVSTSSFAGLNLANSIGAGIDPAKYSEYLDTRPNVKQTYGTLPDVLIRKAKVNGQPNFNNMDYLNLNAYLLQRYEVQLLHSSPGELLEAYFENTVIYFEPTSTYGGGNVIVDRLPWTGLYNRIFSAPVLPFLLLLAGVSWAITVARTRDYARSAGLALPGLYVFLVSVLFERGENMRYKFLLEPAMFVFLYCQLYHLGRSAKELLIRARSPV